MTLAALNGFVSLSSLTPNLTTSNFVVLVILRAVTTCASAGGSVFASRSEARRDLSLSIGLLHCVAVPSLTNSNPKGTVMKAGPQSRINIPLLLPAFLSTLKVHSSNLLTDRFGEFDDRLVVGMFGVHAERG